MYMLTSWITRKININTSKIVPHVRSNYGKHTFKFAVTKTWEEIPTKIKTLTCIVATISSKMNMSEF